MSDDDEGKYIVFKALEWQLDKTNDRLSESLYVNGITEKNQSVACIVDGFTPFVYVELPSLSRGRWNDETVNKLLTYVTQKFQYSIVSHKLTNKANFYYNKPGEYLRVVFDTQRACNSFRYHMARKFEIPGLGVFAKESFKVHESNVDQIIKLTAMQKLPLAGWVRANNIRRFKSSADVSFSVFYKDLKLVKDPPKTQTRSRIVVFDGETYSKNHDAKNPNPVPRENEMFQLSIVTFREGDPEETWKRYLLAIRMGYDITAEGAKVYHVANEKELIRGFIKIVNIINPDIMTGYNILKFDWDYLIKRASFHKILDELLSIGRFPGVPCNSCEKKWKSSAYGIQKFQYLECPGRLNLDVLPEIERNYKFESYSLDNVAKHFLKEGKKEMTAKQLFKFYRFARDTEKYHALKTIREKELKEINKIASRIFTDEEEGVSETFFNSIRTATPKNVIERMKEALNLIAVYCVFDSVVTGKLLTKLNVITGSEQLATVFCVPISYLQTRGQQVKVMSQVYRYTLYHDIVIPFHKYNEDEEEENYWGAYVWDAMKGLWRKIVCEDFTSLYPSAMISENIDHTTYIHPSDTSVPDEECNIREWDEHINCEHDPNRKKGKKVKVLCAHKRHRFRKVVEKDGKLLNEGVLPHILRYLLDERKKVKKEMETMKAELKANKDITNEAKFALEREIRVRDCRQLALKVSANSIYGGAAARTGYFPLIPVAESVTATGREYITIATDYIVKHFPTAKIIYGDTDSCMILFEGASLKEVFALGRRVSKEVTALFPPPVNLDFECVYGTFLLLTKKRYVAEKVNEDGEVYETSIKGVVSKRRDNTKYLKNTYNKLLENVMKNSQDEKKIMYDLYDDIQKLFTRQVEPKNLIISKGINNVIDYAKSESETFIDADTGEKTTTTWFLDKDKKRIALRDGSPVIIKDPLDPRLHYDNLAHVMLALKMLRRGDEVPPNTRLQYVFLNNSGDLQSDKIEDYSYYRENRMSQKFELDYLYYLEKQLVNPVSEVIDVIYRNTLTPLETLDQRIANAEQKLFAKLTDSLKDTVRDCKQCITEIFSMNKDKPYDYRNRIKMATTQIRNCRKGVGGSENLVELFEKLVNLYFMRKSSLVLDKLERIFGMKKRPQRRPINKTDGMYVRDGHILDDILRYRTGYRNVVCHIQHLVSQEREISQGKTLKFNMLNADRDEKILALEKKIYERAKENFISKRNEQ